MNNMLDLESINNEKGDVHQCSSPTEPETPCSNASTSDSEDQTDSYSSSNMRGFLNMLKKGSQMPFQPFQPLKNVPKLRRKSNRIREDLIPPLTSPTLKPSLKPSLTNNFCCFKSSWKNFTLADLQAATDNFSHGNREKLDWNTRYKIALGTAEGLRYLHEECQRRIIHRDIKASNILLLENFEPQVLFNPEKSDCGTCIFQHLGLGFIMGYLILGLQNGYLTNGVTILSPNLKAHLVDEKTDVYAYGVLLLELITGRQALDSSQKSLVMWAKPLLSTDNIKELVDPCLNDDYDEEQMKYMILTASLCIDQSSVLQMSRGEEESLKLIRERQNLPQRTYSEELFDAEDYNSTKFLSDMDRHMETILGSCN
ncbi:unnamed protein product [Lupinus luteus]|uniref:Protein kinase domain-containing protein n=1 Tax=Lupinus luteus TaxID=3873 RepID=A0AAV1XXW1_LUPLU